MRFVVVRAFVRNRHVRTMAFLIILFTSMIVPFYALTKHFKLVEDIASRYLEESNTYLVTSRDGNYSKFLNYNSVFVGIEPATLVLDDVNVSLISYSFSNITLANEILGIGVANLDPDICIVSDFISVKYGLDIGDKVALRIDGDILRFRVGGITKLFPIIIPYTYVDKPSSLVIALSEGQSIDDIIGSGDGYEVYRFHEFFGLVSELRREAEAILVLWSLPIYLIIFVGISIVASRFIYSVREDIRLLNEIGFSRRRILFYIFLGVSPILLLSTIIGISIGIVVSQILGKAMYVIFSGVNVFPSLSLQLLIQILLYTVLSSFLGVSLTFIFGGYRYGETD